MNEPSTERKYLNLGCGRRFHPEWANLDFVSSSPAVRAHNLLEGIPYPDESFDLVYHSHLLEHFSREEAPVFLKECHRVLSKGGIIRIAVPDLENIARLYMEALEAARRGKDGWDANYDWMMLELYDQTVRERWGGGCMGYLSRKSIPNWAFVEKRAGAEARDMRASLESQGTEGAPAKPSSGARCLSLLKNSPGFVRSKLKKVLLRKAEREALELGCFRRSGEIHQWMYDSYSLGRLLRSVGFPQPRKMESTESEIPDWVSYCLDNELDGSTYKPDSLFMEARKPRV